MDRSARFALAFLLAILAALPHLTRIAPRDERQRERGIQSELPSGWRAADIAAAMAVHGGDGPTHVLAWKVEDLDRGDRIASCLVLKELTAPTGGTDRWVAAIVRRDPAPGLGWRVASHHVEGVLVCGLNGEPESVPFNREELHREFFRSRPAAEAVAEFAEWVGWRFGAPLEGGRLVGGRECPRAWAAALGAEPPRSFAADPRPAVLGVLASDLAPADRMAALEPYLNVGDRRPRIEAIIGTPQGTIGHGPGFSDSTYRGPAWTLAIGFYPDGEAYSIRYCRAGAPAGTAYDVLRCDDPVTDPKTTGGRNTELRRRRAEPAGATASAAE